MLELTASAIFEEIRDAETLRDAHLKCYKKILERWLSGAYSSDIVGRPTLENYIDSYLRFTQTQLVSDRPSVSVSPESDANDTPTAEGMEGSINYWIKKRQYKKILQRMARDIVLAWGVTMTYYMVEGKPNYQSEGAAGVIKGASAADACIRTIPIGSYFCDARCYGYENRRLEGHSYDVDMEDVQNDPDYDQEAVATLTPNSETKNRSDWFDESSSNRSAKRKRVTLYDVWIPEANQIITLALQGNYSGKIIKQADYVGPDEGPYTLWGTLEVPGQIYPFSIMAATSDMFNDLNIHAQSAQRGASKYRRVGLGRRANPEDAQVAQKLKNGEIGLMTNPESVVEREFGGVSDAQMRILELLRERLDRNMGYTDAQRGEANSNTATANSIAQDNSDHRMELLKQVMLDCGAIDLRKVGWFFWSQDEISHTYTIQDRISGQSRTVTMYGGQFSPDQLGSMEGGQYATQIGKNWSDYHLTILPESMNKVSDPIRQKRAQDEWAMVNGFSGMLMQAYGPQAMAAINWRRQLDRYGESFNQKDYSKILLTPFADQLLAPDPYAQQMNTMGQVGGQPGQQGSPQQPQQPQMGQATDFAGMMAGATSGVANAG